MFLKSFSVAAASLAVSAATLGFFAQESRADHAPTHDWTGPYIGALVGIGSTDAPGSNLSPASGSGLDFWDFGPLGGLTVGWNTQDGHIVYGIEGDVSFGDVSNSNAFLPGSASPVNVRVTTDIFATIRARAGIAADELFLYGTAGLAILDGDVTTTLLGFPDDGSTSNGFTAFGGVVGAGAELAITEDVSFKAELLYAFFDEDVSIGDFPSLQDGDVANIDNFYSVRFGVNWHF